MLKSASILEESKEALIINNLNDQSVANNNSSPSKILKNLSNKNLKLKNKISDVNDSNHTSQKSLTIRKDSKTSLGMRLTPNDFLNNLNVSQSASIGNLEEPSRANLNYLSSNNSDNSFEDNNINLNKNNSNNSIIVVKDGAFFKQLSEYTNEMDQKEKSI